MGGETDRRNSKIGIKKGQNDNLGDLPRRGEKEEGRQNQVRQEEGGGSRSSYSVVKAF